MTDITDTSISEFRTRITNIVEDDALPEGALDDLWPYLQECEILAIDLINHVLHDAPLPSGELKGTVEFGFVLYWIHYPPPLISDFLDKHEWLWPVWKYFAKKAPPTTIQTTDYNQVMQKIELEGGVVWQDGTIIGTGTYEQLDPRWTWSAINYALNKADPKSVHAFGTTPFSCTLQNLVKDPTGEIKIAIIGDWGTGKWDDYDGTGPAIEIMNEIKTQHNPDYLMHLGDVYYAGTDWRPPFLEEQENFVSLWPARAEKTSFTLNSNHEMYGAASGYFDVALKSGGPFEHQATTSYFALMNKDWAIIGLDSAYYAPSGLYMLGSIGGTAHTQQADFIKGLDVGDRKVMVLTHHNPITFRGDYLEPEVTGGPVVEGLYGQVEQALGRAPDVWYWGHVHDGVVYNGNTVLGAKTLGRCIGHSAIPYGSAWGMVGQDTYDYYANTPDPADQKWHLRVLNGYAILTLNGATLTEEVFEQGNKTPVWPG